MNLPSESIPDVSLQNERDKGHSPLKRIVVKEIACLASYVTRQALTFDGGRAAW
jgi:adenylosuccinate lyase